MIRSILRKWREYRLLRKIPELRHFSEAERQARRAHKRVKHIQAARREFMASCLRGER